MYIEEFILVDIWMHCCTSWKRICMEYAVVYIQTQQYKRKDEIALRCTIDTVDRIELQ